MRHLIFAAALALCPVLAAAADSPDWAYPVTPRPEPADNLILKQEADLNIPVQHVTFCHQF